MPDDALRAAQELGQSIWLDDLSREMIDSGALAADIRDHGITGITSNPKTFHDAIDGSDAYDAALRDAACRGRSPRETYDSLATRDVRDACDLLRQVHERSVGRDGLVSLEVSPRLARDARKTVEEATRLWRDVGRPNLLVKIPATVEGLTAIEECLALGIHVNVTLLFSLRRYREVVEAWFRAMTRRLDRGDPLEVRSVASFFLSRIDTKVDALLDERARVRSPAGLASPLRGRAAIASAKIAYQMWKELFASDSARWRDLRERGALPQKLLWASTSAKDPSYADTKYVEALIGEETICTMPRGTLDAFRDHGRAAHTLEQDVPSERGALEGLRQVGIDLGKVAVELEEEGLRKFEEPFEKSLQAVSSVLSPKGEFRGS